MSAVGGDDDGRSRRPLLKRVKLFSEGEYFSADVGGVSAPECGDY